MTCSRVETRALDFNMRFSAIIPGLRSLSACHTGSEQIDVGCLEQGVHLFLMSLEAVLLHGNKISKANWISGGGGINVFLLAFLDSLERRE